MGAIVVDIGSHTTRAGYAGEDMPKVTKLKSIFFFIQNQTKKLLCRKFTNLKIQKFDSN